MQNCPKLRGKQQQRRGIKEVLDTSEHFERIKVRLYVEGKLLNLIFIRNVIFEK